MAVALTGAQLFDGEQLLDGHTVVIEARRIADVVHGVPTGLQIESLQGGILAPGFIDVQVNGGGGAMLNDTPDVETVLAIARSHRRFGTTGLMPTVITDAPSVLDRAIAAVRVAHAREPSILGIHIEGPFIDMARKGAHAPRFIREMTLDDISQVAAAAACGAVMLTVAPNKVDPQLISELARRGILVSLGHAEASFAETRAALDAGACSFTHLFNAMSQLTGREPGMVGAALADTRSFVGLIADGHHVHNAALAIAIRALGADRCVLVSDAMPAAAGGPDVFSLQGRMVKRQDGRLTLDDGTLAGSNLTMDEAVRYVVTRLDVKVEEALTMASLTPARFLGRDGELGRVRPGYLASLVHLSEDLMVKRTWIEGT